MIQEIRELGLRRSAFRIAWELKTRVGLIDRKPDLLGTRVNSLAGATGTEWTTRLPFSEPQAVAEAMRGLIPGESLEHLRRLALDAGRGRILCFGRWEADYGDPINWHRDPVSGLRREPTVSWPRALHSGDGPNEVKFLWEIGRFPQAYCMARAAAFFPQESQVLTGSLSAQIRSFVHANPPGVGVHWASGQEIVLRLLAWLFALDALLLYEKDATSAADLVREELVRGVGHVGDHVGYARFAVYNNHLLTEALGLYVAGIMLAGIPGMTKLRDEGRRILKAEARAQFYGDGAYINLSHNYHRVALQNMVWAVAFGRAGGDGVPPEWTSAIGRSVGFLVAHQNPKDGRLPNYGSNDGALPGILSTCDFADFRPTLQAANLAVHGERLYEQGPWDEEAAWLLGPKALDAKLARPRRHSVSFGETGFHVLRGERDEGTFATFRCGTIRDRFSQIDMLHFDLFWQGQNILVDGGSYLYNGPKEWHDYFLETGSHNTVMVDGLDQMKHFRQFKCLYWTEAKLLDFRRLGEVGFVAGEHYGYRRHPGACVHRRSAALHDDGAGLVVDTVTGDGRHGVRLHWLFGDYPYEVDLGKGKVSLSTPRGRFSLAVLSDGLADGEVTVAKGVEKPPRGWYSRYYGEKVAVPSLVAEVEVQLPVQFVTGFGPGDVEVAREGPEVVVRSDAGRLGLRLGADGLLGPA